MLRTSTSMLLVALVVLGVAPRASASKVCLRHSKHCIKLPPKSRGQQGPKALTPTNEINGGGVGGGPGRHRDTALAWARTQLGLSRWAWYCERFVEEAYGERGKFARASAAAHALKLKAGAPTAAPGGTLMFFAPDRANRRLGHVGISLGDGRMVSALSKARITDVARDPYWRKLYSGWTDAPASWRGRIPPPPGPAIQDPSRRVQVTGPASGPVNGRTTLRAATSDGDGVRFYAYYATDPGDPGTRGWHRLGNATDVGNDFWEYSWDTSSIPPQDKPAQGTVNVAAVLLHHGDETGTRDYRRFGVYRPATNLPPVATFAVKRNQGAHNPVALDGTASFDPDGTIATMTWKEGDRVLGTGVKLSTTLGPGPSQDVTLEVSDNLGSTVRATQAVALPNRTPFVDLVAPTGTVPGTTPVLSAVAGDDDADALRYDFHIAGPGVDADSGWIEAASWQAPPLAMHADYAWTVTVRDPSQSSDRRTESFRTVAPIPAGGLMTPTSTERGYWEVNKYGAVALHGDARSFGSLADRGVHVGNVIGIARTADDGGYWLYASDGNVWSFGDATFRGSMTTLNKPIVGMAPTRRGEGYWLVAADGGIFAFNAPAFANDLPNQRLNAPISNVAVTPSSAGLWLVGRDGGVFTFGDAAYHGTPYDSDPRFTPSSAVVDLDPTPDGTGYWMTGEDGAVYSFNARYHGNFFKKANALMTGMAATADGGGYWLYGCDGGVFALGNAPSYGATNDQPC